MSFSVKKTFTTECNSSLLDYINENSSISPELEEITINQTESTFWFSSELSQDEEIELDNILSSWICEKSTEFWDNVPSGFTESMNGSLYSTIFVRETTTKNVWMSSGGDGTNFSDKTRHIVPFDSELISITVSNAKNKTAFDLEVWKGDFNSDTHIKIVDWKLSNVRSAVNNTFSPISCNAGDKLGVFIEDHGVDMYRSVVTLYFRAINRTIEEKIDNLNERFKR